MMAQLIFVTAKKDCVFPLLIHLSPPTENGGFSTQLSGASLEGKSGCSPD